jgi:hypothetical protein
MKYPEITKKLKKMVEEDQKIRREINFDNPDQKLLDKMKKIDNENQEELKKIIEKIGWPTISKVGAVTSKEAWLIAQHSDYDFQKKCLSLMKNNKNDIRGIDLAYLTDRTLIRENKPQIYGTQLTKNKEGKLEPHPIKDRKNVDRRREEIELKKLDHYIKIANKK